MFTKFANDFFFNIGVVAETNSRLKIPELNLIESSNKEKLNATKIINMHFKLH